ncbi:ThuA domain-containing protein [Streptomyces sp. NPDC050560]|uniref:ThuA domain-containing protein n=1 Tax=Streptomyces sp. NPDC050560 TaxID=3365630 RepID=UPI0037AED307
MTSTATRITVYTRTTGYRHESIEAGVECVAGAGPARGLAVRHTEDPDELTRLLPESDAVVFLSTSGNVLTAAGREALRAHTAAGRGFVGVHAAACTEYDWPFYEELLGAWFDGHPELQPGTAVVEDAAHPAMAHLQDRWDFVDEWYNFRANPRPRVRVLATADESSYEGGGMGADHPLVWCHERLGGRVFYTGLGHTRESFRDPAFARHLLGAVAWAARVTRD